MLCSTVARDCGQRVHIPRGADGGREHQEVYPQPVRQHHSLEGRALIHSRRCRRGCSGGVDSNSQRRGRSRVRSGDAVREHGRALGERGTGRGGGLGGVGQARPLRLKHTAPSALPGAPAASAPLDPIESTALSRDVGPHVTSRDPRSDRRCARPPPLACPARHSRRDALQLADGCTAFARITVEEPPPLRITVRVPQSCMLCTVVLALLVSVCLLRLDLKQRFEVGTAAINKTQPVAAVVGNFMSSNTTCRG